MTELILISQNHAAWMLIGIINALKFYIYIYIYIYLNLGIYVIYIYIYIYI